MDFVKRHPLLTGFGTLAIIVLLAVVIARGNQSAEELTSRALRNYQLGFLTQASSDIQRALAIDSDDETSLVVAATISLGLNDVAGARGHYARIKTARLLDRHMMLADASIRAQQLEFAEQILQTVLARRADFDQAHQMLLELYRMTYQEWKHRQLMFELMLERDPLRTDVEFLFGIQNPQNSSEIEFRETARDLNHPDRLVRLTACINHVRHDRLAQARDALQQLVLERPDLIDAQATLGLLFVGLDDTEGLREWFAELPGDALEHPNVCYATGVLFEKLGAPADALAFYKQALMIDYRHRGALEKLTSLVDQSDEQKLEQLRGISALENELQELMQSQTPNPESGAMNPRGGELVLDLLERLGWLYEARAWCSLFHGDDAARFDSRQVEIEKRLEESSNAAQGIELDWPKIAQIVRSMDLPESPTEEWILEQQAAFRGE